METGKREEEKGGKGRGREEQEEIHRDRTRRGGSAGFPFRKGIENFHSTHHKETVMRGPFLAFFLLVFKSFKKESLSIVMM